MVGCSAASLASTVPVAPSSHSDPKGLLVENLGSKQVAVSENSWETRWNRCWDLTLCGLTRNRTGMLMTCFRVGAD